MGAVEEDTTVEEYNTQFNKAVSWYHDHIEDELDLAEVLAKLVKYLQNLAFLPFPEALEPD